MSIAYERMLIKRGGGVVACGEHLGVFVSHPDNLKQTPAGWAFVDVTSTTAEQLSEAIAHTTKGRSCWPDDPNGRRPGTKKPSYGQGYSTMQARGGR